ncbi:MAG: TetR/AcrR family transcriptional regulator [Acidobacteriota bacterium]|nr:TetR/AcrR family transcriptional regulator [Acidobacteriota bacterium]
MSSDEPLRADARENRRRLIEAAREAFARGGTVPLEDIATAAGVGIGTLYRHFPKREALVAAVYHDQIHDLRAGAEALLSEHPPVEALRMWMDLFAEWAAAKRGMVETLAAMRRSGALDFEASRGEIEAILATLLAAGRDTGEIRADVDPADLRSLLAGAMAVAESSAHAGRLFDLVLAAVQSCAH